ncbi:MAG: hypothetical protein Tsb0020_18850 [Haliangiales bacterium]
MSRALPSLRRNVSWAFIGHAVYAASQWLILVVLARLGDPTMVGQFGLGLALAAPAFMLCNLQLRVAVATDVRDTYGFGDYLGLRLLTTAAALATIAVIALGADYRPETAAVLLLVGVSKAVEAICDLCYGWFQKHERMALWARSLILRGGLGLAAVGATLTAGAPITAAVVALAGVWLAVLAAHDVPAALRLLRAADAPDAAGRADRAASPIIRLDRARMSALVRLSWPLGLSMLFVSLTHNIPRYLVEHQLGEAGLGIFVAMAYVPLAGDVVVRALGQAATPRLAKHYADSQGEDPAAGLASFDRLLGRLLLLGLGFGVGGVVVALFAGELVLALLFGPTYAAHADVFLWVMVGGGLLYLGSLLGYGVAATRAFERFTGPYAAVAAVSLVAAATLVPRFGLAGAAWALCAVGVATAAAPLAILYALRRPQRRQTGRGA